MSKDTFYFPHDYNARKDPKIKKLIQKHSLKGYGLYWAIVEDLYDNANALPTDYDTIAYDLRMDESIVKSVIEDFDLFVIDGNEFGSLSIQRRFEARDEKSKKARESARKRWDKEKDDANALPSECEPNAIKESKVKEKKEKESKGKEIKVIKKKEDLLIYPFDSLIFKNAWSMLISEKKWKGKSDNALQMALKLMSECTEEESIQMMSNTIQGNYQGIFKLKENGKQTTKNGNGNRSELEELSRKLKARHN